jgi:hypothetical protein
MKKPLLRIFFTALVCAIVVLCSTHADESASTNQQQCSEWIYMRHVDMYLYFIRHADINDKERALVRKKAYELFFQYWILHRSDHAICPPVPKFEEYFSRLVKNDVMKFVDADDPLSIKPLYKDGMCQNSKILPQVEGLTDADINAWADYQKLVGKFKETFKFE